MSLALTRPDPHYDDPIGCHESGALCGYDCECNCLDCDDSRAALAPCDDCKDRGYTLEAGKAYACGGSCDAKLVKSIARVELRLARSRSARIARVLDKHLSLLQSLLTTMPELPDLRPIVAELEGRSVQLLAEAKKGVA